MATLLKNTFRVSVAVVALLSASSLLSVASAADGKVVISSPKDGATLSATSDNKIDFEVTLGSGDDHFHIWVDDNRGGPVRGLKGSETLPKMAPGEHVITIKIVDKGHVPTGPAASVKVKVQ